MSDITVTNVDDAIVRAIDARAAATGRSTEDIIREALRFGLLLDRSALRDVAKRIRDMTPGPVTEDSTAMIRRLRDSQ
jgi:plasmid stability protein